MPKRPTTLLLFLLLFVLPAQAQTITIDKVEPPNWWVDMQWNHVQLMVYGSNLDGITASFKDDALKVTAIHSVPNSNYTFLDVDLAGDIAPGNYMLQLNKGNQQASVTFPILAREKNPSRNRGFSVDDVVYLITPDRFANGNRANDRADGLIDEYDPTKPHMRHGGDLQGIKDRLGYLKDLGITAIWLNPILESNAHNSYHGYQATNHYRIDPRYGSNEEYKAFVLAAHEHGIKVIFDHVNNHIGIMHPWMEDLPTETWINGSKTDHLTEKHYKMAFSDPYGDPLADEMLRTFWFVDEMPDVNQKDPFVATYLIQNSIWWMEYTGLDGFREDTYPYPDQGFLADWAGAILKEYPRSNIVGEIWETEPAYLSLFQKESYFPRDFETNLPTIMDFPLTVAWRDFLEGKARLDKVYKVLAQDFVYTDRDNILTFVDNHDMARSIFISDDNTQKVKLVFAMLFTLRGIPQMLYGSEINMMGGQSHVELRADFPGGFPGQIRDAFTESGRTEEENDMFSYVRTLLHLRKEHEVLRRGRLIHYPVAWNENIYKYVRLNDEETILMIINGDEKNIEVDLSEQVHLIGDKAEFRDLISGEVMALSDNQSLPVDALRAYALQVLK